MLDSLKDIMNIVIYWNTIWMIILSVLIFMILYFIVNLFLKKLDSLDKKESEKKRIQFLSKIMNKFPKWIFILMEIFISVSFLNFSDKVSLILKSIFFWVVTIFVIKIIIKWINYSMERFFSKDKTAKKSIETIITVLVWALWIFVFLTNIWIDLTPVLAWFWIAWIAVAFALQNILTDLFSSFSIILSKPFIVGDYIKIWEWSSEKIWKQISLKSTTLQTVQWQEVIIPNSNILATEVINYRTMKNRRQRISIWVTYDTWIKKLKIIPEIIKDIVSQQKDVEYERCYLEKMWDFSINFLMSYNILNPDYEISLKINEKIYLELIENFNKEWIEFAFPSQTIYVSK